MNLKEHIQTIARRQDERGAHAVAEYLAMRYGFRYRDMMEFVNDCGVDPNNWEELLQEAD